MKQKKSYAPYLIILGLVMILAAIGQLGGTESAWADTLHQGCGGGTIPDPSCLTPQPGGGGSGGTAIARIVGTVIDLSTGKAGAGITIRINNDQVTTDSFGDYSLSGVANGEYWVDLSLEGDAIPAQEPVVVFVSGPGDYVVNLDYYSVRPTGGVQPKQLDPVGAVPGTGASDSDADTDAQTTQTIASDAGQSVQPTQVDASSGQTGSDSTMTDSASSEANTTEETASEQVEQGNQDRRSETMSSVTADATPQPQSDPEALPQTGAQRDYSWWIVFTFGIALLILGLKLSKLGHSPA